MHHLGVPTTRALSLVLTGDMVVRDVLYDGNPAPEPGAVVCRVAPIFVRFGNFQLPASRGDADLLRQLVDSHHPQRLPASCAADGGPITEAPIGRWFAEVCRRTADAGRRTGCGSGSSTACSTPTTSRSSASPSTTAPTAGSRTSTPTGRPTPPTPATAATATAQQPADRPLEPAPARQRAGRPVRRGRRRPLQEALDAVRRAVPRPSSRRCSPAASAGAPGATATRTSPARCSPHWCAPRPTR